MRLTTVVELVHLSQLRPFLSAPIKSLGATRVEGTPLGDGIQSRHGAIDLVQALAVDFHVGD
jgi:hypothetical protein